MPQWVLWSVVAFAGLVLAAVSLLVGVIALAEWLISLVKKPGVEAAVAKDVGPIRARFLEMHNLPVQSLPEAANPPEYEQPPELKVIAG